MGEALAARLDAELFVDEGEHRSRWNHARAWEWAAGLDHRALIVEDDIEPAPDLRERAAEWFQRFPDDLVNFYLGTGWPYIEKASIAALAVYDAGTGPDHLRIDQLFGAQCYSVPTRQLQAVIDDHRHDLEADFALGAAWIHHNGRGIVHVLESLVEHRDVPSVSWTPEQRPVPRRARRLHVAAPPAS